MMMQRHKQPEAHLFNFKMLTLIGHTEVAKGTSCKSSGMSNEQGGLLKGKGRRGIDIQLASKLDTAGTATGFG